jgi:hypothetical protein
MDSSRCSSAWSGTSDCTNNVAWFGSTPDAQPVDHHVGADILKRPGLLVVRRERVPVGDEEQAWKFGLQPHPVLQHAVVVAQVQRSGRAHAGKDAGFDHQKRNTEPMTLKEVRTIGARNMPR